MDHYASLCHPQLYSILTKYLYEVKEHQRQHVINGCHVLGESVHDPAWKRTRQKPQCLVVTSVIGGVCTERNN